MVDYLNIEWDDILEYSAESPSCLKWKIRNSNRINVGDSAGCKAYADKQKTIPKCWFVGYNGSIYRAHRIIWILLNKELDDKLGIDHINGNPFDNSSANLRLVQAKINSTNVKMSKFNKTGVNGVTYFTNKNGNQYFVARWQVTNDFKRKSNYKHFNIDKLGEAEAFRLACEHRKQMITELNLQGAGYTDRHGT